MKINRCISCENQIESYPCPHCGFDGDSYRQPEHALPCNAVLHGRYLVGRVLGQGGFGITYIGWDLVLQYKCAIKEYYPRGQAMRKNAMGLDLCWGSDDQSQRFRRVGMDSFLKEARKMNKVDHIPEVVRVRDTFIEHETAYIVMDYVEGQTLQKRLETDGVLSWEQAARIFLPVISAMEKVHQAGLIHRDLSPDNLMLLPDGSVKILDLGAAKDLSIHTGASSMQVAKGGFSPLEQYTQRGSSGPWSDVYAMAATMYYALTGVLPPTAVDRVEADIISWELPQLKALPRVVLAALQKAMAVTASTRTRSMGEFLKQLKSPPESPKKPERKPISKKIRILAAVLAAALLGGLVYSVLPAPEEKQLAVPTETTAASETIPEEPAEQTIATEPTAPPHAHIWTPATAGRPARCSVCGIMTGTALPQTILAGNANGLVYGVKNDGTVAESYTYSYKVPDDVKQWQNIAAICKSWEYVYGIRNDGTVAYVHDENSVPPVDGWTDIASVTDSLIHVAGLRRDGTVVTERISHDRSFSDYNIVEGEAFAHTESWSDIVAVTAGAVKIFDPYKDQYSYNSVYTYKPYTVGLKADGTLVFASEEDLFPEAGSWTDIVAITAVDHDLLGLKADGTVVAAWDDNLERSGISAERRARIEAWTDIIQIDCDSNEYWYEGKWCTESTVVGLKADGTVVMEANWVGDVSRSTVESWTDMVAVSADTHVVMGLRSNGSTANISMDYNQKTKTQNYLWSGIKVPS